MTERYQRIPLKLVVKYGMSGHRKAFRPHLIDPELSYAKYFPGKPEFTAYRFRWMCGMFSDKYLPQFLRGPFAESEVCAACQRAQAHRKWMMDRGWDLAAIHRLPPAQRRIQYAMWYGAERVRNQSPEAPF